MKYVRMLLRLLLPVAAIVLLVSWMVKGADDSKLLGVGLICSGVNACLNLYFQRKPRKAK